MEIVRSEWLRMTRLMLPLASFIRTDSMRRQSPLLKRLATCWIPQIMERSLGTHRPKHCSRG